MSTVLWHISHRDIVSLLYTVYPSIKCIAGQDIFLASREQDLLNIFPQIAFIEDYDFMELNYERYYTIAP